jgi:hypothetical protein
MSRSFFIGVAALLAAICWSRAASPHETVSTTVLFDREIVGILNRHCVMCHVEKGPSFPLETYEQAWLERRKISAAVLARRMPPWPAMSGYGRFANENVVTLRESQFLVSWMEGLGPRNAGKVFTNTSRPDAPAQQAVRASMGFGVWHLGQPDLVRELEPNTVGPSAESNGVLRTVIDLGLSSERRIRAFEYMPGDRRVVRDAVFTVQETGQWIGSWTPWYGFVELPRSTAYRLPAGAHLVAQIRYQQADVMVVDRGKIGLFFDTQPGLALVSDLVIEAKGTKRLRGEVTLAADTALLALRPDVESGLTSVEVSAKRPDGGTDVLLFAKDLRAGWATPYIFAEPVTLRRGTTLAITAYGADGPVSMKTTISTVRFQ